MKRFFIFAALLVTASAAIALETPKLPAGAKKLKGSEIEAAYKDKRFLGSNFDDKSLVSFDVTTESATKTIKGNWKMASGESGEINMTYRIQNDKWCYKPVRQGKEKCVAVYVDSAGYYELNAKGTVSSTHN